MKIKENYMLRKIAGESVVVPFGDAVLNFQGMITLNDTGAFLWQQLAQGCTLTELMEALVEEYEVDRTTAARDVEAFISKMAQENLLDAD
ncbi:PqqD family protein [Eubacterium barkeri]|uniref:Coenzyme PQQ synthesis protein D (PqqD) n=1 Tax=Eubacterium barkeri TaxID=1528 RepID=A0A1H3EKK2_EUBBA|nr:PqqD family protein [Eubacterium barkeri]SDX79303.1 Coenzyme PQQ synthesis protein D (PqqD) [Eubacterium barkeri]